MTDIARLGIQVDSSTVPGATARLKGLQGATKGLNRETRRFNARGVIQQVSQIAQQASVTGNVLQAVSVQAFDIGLAFGAVGTAAGIAAGLLLPLAGNLFGTGDSAERAMEALDAFEASVSEVIKLANVAATPLADLRKEFGEFADEVQRASQIAAQISLSQALDGLRGTSFIAHRGLRRMVEEISAASDLLGRGAISSDEFDFLRQEAEKAAEAIGLTGVEGARLAAALHQISDANSMEEVARAAAHALDLFGDMQDGGRLIEGEVAEIVLQLESVLSAAAAGVAAFDDMGVAAAGAASQAERLARVIAYASSASQNTISGFESDDPRSGGPGSLDTTFDYGRRSPFSRRTERTRGGGASPDREHQRRLREAEAVLRRLETATEEYNRELEDLNELHRLGYLNAEQFAGAVDLLDAEFQALKFEGVIADIEGISDAFAGAIVQGESLGDAFKNVLQRMVQDLLASNIRNLIGGIFGIRRQPAGGGLLGGLFGGLLSFEGGGYTGDGPRSGGVDGKGGFPAILHPQETVSDHTKGGSGIELIVRQEPGVVVEIARNEANTIVRREAPAIARAGANQAIGGIRQSRRSTIGA